jgi:predicted nucleic acid-binding protein
MSDLVPWDSFRRGLWITFSDLLIVAICINRDEELVTKDKDFRDIAETSNLKVKLG